MSLTGLIGRAVSLARKNPYLFLEYARKRMRRASKSWVCFKPPPIISVNGVKLPVPLDLAEKNLDYFRKLYFDCFELPVVNIVKATLRSGDTFLDIGANIGYYSALAAGLVGVSGRVLSFEPIPSYFANLQRLKFLNETLPIEPHCIAMGERNTKAVIDMADDRNAGASTLVGGLLDWINKSKKMHIGKTGINVEVVRVDDFLESHGIINVRMVKIDVEGYEFPVLRGMSGFFKRAEKLPDIICEVTPHAYPFLGYRVEDLLQYMQGFGYGCFDVYKASRRVSAGEFTSGVAQDVVFRYDPMLNCV